jgi:D-lactate dehydrogenase
MLTPAFSEPADRGRYEAFMEDLVALIVDKYDGSLKAEHGTGLNMAPWVEREWGPQATDMMWRIKALADPDGVLSPGVLLNRDSGVHLRNLKTAPPIEAEADNCVECGFCEPVCPSRDLTTTPRQRIVLRREMARQPAGSPVLRALLEEYEYDAIETCAADGTCMISCPLGIDTGKLVKELRARQHGPRAERVALAAARRWAAVERGARAGLRAGPPARGATRAIRKVVSHELVPEWPADMPPPAPARLPATVRDGAAAVYLPACINRIFGSPRELGLPEALVAVSARAGTPVWIPPDVAGHCCSTPWSSKGYRAGADFMAAKTLDSLWEWSDEGRLPIVTDASSCALGLIEDVVRDKLTVLDSLQWAHDTLLPGLQIQNRVGRVAVHPTCSARHLGAVGHLKALAGALAEEVYTPPSAFCCGFAGDRGFLHPELPAAATADEAAELSGHTFDAHLCSNRTCEIGLRQGTGRNYESFIFLLEELTRPA